MQDLRNIELSFNVGGSHRLDKDDATAVDILVSNLKEEEYSSVLSYKPLGTALGNFREEDFILVLQTAHQKDMYKLFASTVICIDSTHGTNAYGYKLITMMVVDDYGQGALTVNSDFSK